VYTSSRPRYINLSVVSFATLIFLLLRLGDVITVLPSYSVTRHVKRTQSGRHSSQFSFSRLSTLLADYMYSVNPSILYIPPWVDP